MVVAETLVSLQLLRRFIVMMKDCGPVALCGKGLFVAFCGVHGPLILRQEAHCCTQPSRHSWQEACCGPLWWICPPWCTLYTRPWRHMRCFWRTHHAQPWHICTDGYHVARYGCHCILWMTTWTFDCCAGVATFSPCLCFLLSLLLAIQQKEMIVTLLMFTSWCHDQPYHWGLAPLWSLMWLIHIDEKGSLLLAWSAVFVAINHHYCSPQ